MNKQELVDAIVAKNPEVTKKLAGEVLGATLDAISDALAKGDSVQLIGFGTFEVKATSARIGRNPATGAELQIKAGKKVGFKVGKVLKERVNN